MNGQAFINNRNLFVQIDNQEFSRNDPIEKEEKKRSPFASTLRNNAASRRRRTLVGERKIFVRKLGRKSRRQTLRCLFVEQFRTQRWFRVAIWLRSAKMTLALIIILSLSPFLHIYLCIYWVGAQVHSVFLLTEGLIQARKRIFIIYYTFF